MRSITKEHKSALFRIVLSLACFVGGLLFKCFAPAFLHGWGAIILFVIAWAACGYPVIFEAVENIFHGDVFDENFLMTLATIGALALKDYPEAAGVMIFFQVGELFEHIAVHRSRNSITALMDFRPDSATVIENSKEISKAPDAVAVGDILLVRPGERIPVDGIILEGAATIDTSMITGESMPASVQVGSEVLSGCINLSGVLKLRAQSSYAQSTVAKILELVENASAKKARAERLISRFARIYTPTVVLGAVLLALIPPLLFSGLWSEWVRRALTFLVISCPCALVISVPLSYFCGMGAASRIGVIVKGGTALEQLAKTKIAVFDKTGTLTTGEFSVQSVHPICLTQEELLALAASAEIYSAHPVGRAIRNAAKGGTITPTQTNEVVGCGMEAVVDGKNILVGNEKMMQQFGVAYTPIEAAGTVVYLASEGRYLGAIVVGDSIRPQIKDALLALKQMGIQKNVMLTGDVLAAAARVASESGMDAYYAGLLPQNKVTQMQALMPGKQDGTLLFAGDGVNDAPVLAMADVGIAMGGVGSDAAVEAADVVMLNDDITRLPKLIKIARRTIRIARENIIFALAVKAAVLALGALGYAPMFLAIIADVGVAVLAILNALRTMRVPNGRVT